MDRGRFLRAGAAFALLPVLGCGGERLPDYPFRLGVASGDPSPDGFVIWTRLAPEPLAEDGRGGMPPDRKVLVRWEVSEEEGFGRGVVRRGRVEARPELGHSVHVEVGGLRAGRWYWYRFEAGGEVSPVGRARTAPPPGRRERLSFAVASCQAWTRGDYPAYRRMAEEDLDLVLHLGDYVYEEEDTRTLADFRRLYGLYKSAPGLQAAHAAFPFAAVLDDHEVDNDWAGSYPEDYPELGREEFLRIRAAAFQAYYEHMPLRPSSLPQGPRMRLHRRLRFGSLAEIHLLDTRQYRDDQPTGRLIAPREPEALAAGRSMLGDEQRRWLFAGLQRSRTSWNLIAQQTMLARYDYDTGPGVNVNHDQWDGYAAARERLLGFLRESRPPGPVVLSGDWHAGFVNDLKADFRDPASGTVAPEIVTTSISSGCPWAERVKRALGENPHVRYFGGDRRGYVRCSLGEKLLRADFRLLRGAGVETAASWVVESGSPEARRA
ncbi:alkaline phosphatase D family protein [Rubrobacter xylanophilus]|uniref:alkaline phosphatase D family protein n=1 Tax=Rubrobacter xylanophilus TaxID=49319 RepID=UPI001C644389